MKLIPALLFALVGCTAPGSTPEGGMQAGLTEAGVQHTKITRRLGSMGTSLVIEVAAIDRTTALKASERAVRALEETEARLSTWREDSELALLNQTTGNFTVSPTTARELRRTLALARETEGAFDPTIGALVDAWDLRGEGRVPRDEERARALEASSHEYLKVTGEQAVRLHPDLRVEEGGFGKGAGLDRAMIALRKAGAARATLDLGGQVAFLGPGTHTLHLAHPSERDQEVVTLTVPEGSVATSSNSERSTSASGHLLDPRTGAPATFEGSMTVWAEDALTADALSTAMFVLGPKDAFVLAESLEGVELCILELVHDNLHLHFTSGMDARWIRTTDD